MKRSTRRIIFYFLVLAFAVTGPMAVLSSLGYAFRPGTATFESTGGIFIKSETPRTSVFLNGALVRETGFLTGNTLLTDITPGMHLLRVEKPTFRPWTKTVTVAPAQVTEFRDVFLVPHVPAIATSSNRELAAATATSTTARLFSMDKKGRLLFTAAGIPRIISENAHSFASVPDGAWFVGQNGFLAHYDLARQEVETVGRPGFFLDRTPVRFADGEEFLTVIDSSGGLFLYDKASGAVTPVAAGVKEALFDTEEEKLLVVKDQEIAVMWLKDHERQPFQRRGVMETVVQGTDTIREARWYYGTEAHVAYRTRAGVFIAEGDIRGGVNAYALLPDPVDEIITSSLAPNAIFYRQGKNIYKIEL